MTRQGHIISESEEESSHPRHFPPTSSVDDSISSSLEHTSFKWLKPSRGSVNSAPDVLLIILLGTPATNSAIVRFEYDKI